MGQLPILTPMKKLGSMRINSLSQPVVIVLATIIPLATALAQKMARVRNTHLVVTKLRMLARLTTENRSLKLRKSLAQCNHLHYLQPPHSEKFGPPFLSYNLPLQRQEGLEGFLEGISHGLDGGLGIPLSTPQRFRNDAINYPKFLEVLSCNF